VAATFVFDGTIRRIAGSTRGRTRTAGVRVDAIVRAPALLGDLVGRTVTVQQCGVPLRVGDRARFSTTPLMFGDAIVVRAERQSPAPRSSGGRRAVAPGVSSVLRRRLAAADVVVSGRVTAIRPAVKAARPAQSAARSAGGRRISEHDPQWCEALISVAAVHKGRRVRRVLRVRFPAGTDVAWARAPKLRLHQRGVFLLKRTGATFTALDPADVQPASLTL
jgi:hypothetical protein